MAEGRVDDGMIEIGDPNEESPSPETPPQVVIQYHERGGVPWMLIPPLLVLSAVAAILLYQKLVPRAIPSQPRELAKAAEVPGSPVDDPVTTVTTPATPVEVAASEKRAEEANPPAPIAPIEPVAPPSAPSEPVKVPEPDSVPFPRVQGLGFDPKALEADRRVEAPADPALAPAVRDDLPDDRDKPREVDPDLLPPDPRLARVRQQQRRLDARKKIEDERIRFHADLKTICSLKFRRDTGKKLDDLRKRYDTRVDPASETRAADLLGKNGKFVGADRRTRIEILRGLGYPEPAILADLFHHYGSKMLGERDGPSTLEEALYQSALFLIRTPPAAEAPSPAVSNVSNGPGGRANRSPAASANTAGPAR